MRGREAFASAAPEGDGLMAQAITPMQPTGKLPENRCFAVLGFDSASDTVKLWNPWGNDFTPAKGPSGPENGYTRTKGVFAVKTDDSLKLFKFLAVEKR